MCEEMYLRVRYDTLRSQFLLSACREYRTVEGTNCAFQGLPEQGRHGSRQ
jgi:hypothetical protein